MNIKRDPKKRKTEQVQFFRLMILSTFIFVLCSLTVRFVTNLQTAFFLKLFSINFEYRPYGVIFHSFGGLNWTDTKIMIVYGVGTLIFFLLGLFILRLLSVIKSFGFRTRLALTWLAFLLVHILPMGMLSGTFIFDGFGVAYTWLFEEVLIRLIVALGAIGLSIFLRPFWINIFIKTAYTTDITTSLEERKDYIIRVFKVPYLFGLAILIPFTLTAMYWSWFVYLVGLSLIVLPIVNQTFPPENPRIFRRQGPVFHSKYSIISMILIIVCLFLISFLHS